MMEQPLTKKTRRGRECACYGCTNTQYDKDGRPTGVSLFVFPMKNPKRDRWCNLIKRQHGRDGFSVTKLTVICEQHFKSGDIYKPPGGTRCRLKSGVEPSIFPWQSNITKPKRRVLCRNPTSSTSTSTQRSSTVTIEKEIIVEESFEGQSGSFLDDYMYNEETMDEETFDVIDNDRADKAVQTDFGSSDLTDNIYEMHSYSFSFCNMNTFGEQQDYNRRLEEKIENQRDVINSLKTDICELKEQLEEYEKKRFTLENYKDDNKAIQFYTNFPNYETLIAVYEYLAPKVGKLQYWNGKDLPDSQPYQEKPKSKPGRKRNLTGLQEFWMVLVRLKVGLFVKDLSDRFDISPGHFSKIFTTWINFLYLEMALLFPFPSQADIRRNMPLEFSRYPQTRIIIDCTELFIEVPSSLKAQSETWSNYKHHNTFKVLVGVSPNGTVTFVSKLWGGRVSDKTITNESGVIDLLDVGDNVMADRGFDIHDILPPGVHLNLPPFKGTRQQLTATEVEETARIASVRIHVERAIGRIKNYHILDGVMPVSLAHVADKIFTVCSFLTNFSPPLLEPAGAKVKS